MSDENIRIALATLGEIAPFAPFLVELGKDSVKKASEVIVEKMGETAWKRAKALWDRLKSGSANDSELINSMELLAAKPEDMGRREMFAEVLAVRLRQEPELASDLKQLLGVRASVQEVLADKNSWVEDIEQRMQGSGSQSVSATDDSVILDVQQNIG
jgi:hypothetical protein